MNEPDFKEKQRFQQAADRRLSGLQGDPWLAKRIINGEIKEKKMKKKVSLGLVLAAALVCVLAFALAENWQEVQGVLTQRDLVTQQPPRQAAQAPEGKYEADPDEWAGARITDYVINENKINVTLEITSLRKDISVFEEQELFEGEFRGEEDPLNEKMLTVNGEECTVAQWGEDRQLVECFISLESEAAIPSNLWWYYHTTHTRVEKTDRLTVQAAFFEGLEPGMFTEEKPLCLLVTMRNLDTGETQYVSIPLPSLPESADEGTVPPLPAPDATLTPEQAMERTLALEADRVAPSPEPTVSPMPAATLTPDQSKEMAIATDADSLTPAQTVALHRWLYERVMESAAAIGRLAQPDLYLDAVGLSGHKYYADSGVRAWDFSSPQAMRLYALDLNRFLDQRNIAFSGNEDNFALAEARRYISLESASVGPNGENAASETVRPAAFMTVTSACTQPGGLADTVVTLDFEGDCTVCCVFTVYADGTVLCDSGVITSDLPGDIFIRTGSYEGVALELLKESE